MSMKEKRNVTFEEPNNNHGNGNAINASKSTTKNISKEESRSRSRARSRSWSRFRTRRAKSQDVRSTRDSSTGSTGSSGIKRDRSLVNLVRTGSRNSVRSLVKLFETRSMNEGRKTQIVLLDERRLDIIIQPKLYSSDLLDLVSSHFKLREKQYFGLGFFDDTNHFNWLLGEKRVLDHEFPKKTGLLVLHFAIRFYVDTIGLLRDTQTVELFYLNARLALFRGQIECDTETVFELAAHVLQATNGDFVSEEETKEELKKLPVIPTSCLKEHPSITYCEDRVIGYYEKLNGTSRGLAIVNYMTILEKLPTYGIHYYDVKDKKDIPWWLGISPKGIAVYDKNDKTTPRKLFTWKNLENLYYRDRKFSIEVHGPKREETGSHIIHTLSSFNPYEDAVREPAESQDDLSTAISDPTTQVSVSRRTFGASNVDVHAWFASTPQLTKCIWSMAVAQHQFYLDKKQSKTQLPSARSMSEIAAELCRSTTSLPGSLGSDISRSPSSHSLPSLSNSRYDLTIEQSDSLKAEREMYQALKARKEALEDALRKKTEELKLLCLQEGELTGELPKETPLAYGEPLPVFRRRVGTAFSLSVKSVQDINSISSELSKLELEVDLQCKITSAAQRLASDKTVSKYVRKQRKQSYIKANAKLKDMEKKLAEMQKQVGKSSASEPLHRTGRAFDGMYHVIDPRSNSDLDLDHISLGYVHVTPCARQDDSCGNSIHSGDSGVTTEPSGYRDMSCGNSPSMSSAFSHSSRQLSDSYSDDLCSLSDSLSPQSARHIRDDISSGFYSIDESRSPGKISGFCLDEDRFQTLKPSRMKHFIVSRGSQNSRLLELKSDFSRSRSTGSIQSECSSKASETKNLALSEVDDDDDSDSLNDTRTVGNDSLDYDDSTLRKDGQGISTRVVRRKQTFIVSKRLSKPLNLDSPRTDIFEKAYKAIEEIYLAEKEETEEKEVTRGRCRKPRAHVNSSQFQSPALNEKQLSRKLPTEFSLKVQSLITNSQPVKPLTRSRSFDASIDARVSPIKDGSGQSKDDFKNDKNKPKESLPRKSFQFFGKKREKPKQLKKSVSEIPGLVVYGCASAVAAPLFNAPVNLGEHVTSRSNEGNKKTSGRASKRFDNVSDQPSLEHPTNNNDQTVSYNKAAGHQYPRSYSAAAVVESQTNKTQLNHVREHCHFGTGLSSVRDLSTAVTDGQLGHTLVSESENGSVVSECAPLRRRSSWHSSSRPTSLSTNGGIETTV